MFTKIAAFELRYQLKNPVFWVVAILFFLLAFGATTVEQIQIGSGGNVKVNSPAALAQKLLMNERELLVVALQDLYAGELAWQERLPGLHRKTGSALAAFIEDERNRAALQAQQLLAIANQMGRDPNGAPNLWLNAVLDDAERDAATIVAGPLRDIALVGALRKGKQSERVSYETALGLAAKLGENDIARALTTVRDEENHADAELSALLMRLLT